LVERGATGLLVETVDVLDHVPAHAVGMRGLGANLDEARTREHLGGADVVFGDACEQPPRQLDLSKRVECSRGKPPTPTGWVDPVGDFSLTLYREAPDRPANAPSSSIASNVQSESLRMRS
jgi:hypothetical protein